MAAEEANKVARAKLPLRLILAGCGVAVVLLAMLAPAFYRGFSKGYADSFKVSFQRSVADSCTQAAASNGTPAASARTYCACFAQYMVEHHTVSELTLYSGNVNSPEARKAVSEAMTTCQRADSLKK